MIDLEKVVIEIIQEYEEEKRLEKSVEEMFCI